MTQELEYPLTGWMGKNGKQRNRRVVTVEHLRTMKRWVTWIVAHWEVESWTVMTDEERKAQGPVSGFRSWRRPRRPDEYPENSPEEWRKLARTAQAIENEAAAIRSWAYEQSILTRKRLEEGH